ncbi:MAG: ComF family protein [Firmicutes bacterium]|nr:ComF family protein [Bacillota bacterium]
MSALFWNDLLRAALELVFPPRRVCPLCGGDTRDSQDSPGGAVCGYCSRLLAGYAGEPACPCCGAFLPSGAGQAAEPPALCPDCRPGRPFAIARAVGPYEEMLRDAVHRLKYYRARWLARPMAMLMAETFRRYAVFTNTQGLVPVPLHPARERWRGFNQSALLARVLGEVTGLPVLERAVARIRETPPQTGLTRQERMNNLAGAFLVREPERVSGKIITIIDDVFTTGTTVSHLSQELRQVGASGIMVLTFAVARQTKRM